MSAASAAGQEWFVVAGLVALVVVMVAGQAVRRWLDHRRRRGTTAVPAAARKVPATHG